MFGDLSKLSIGGGLGVMIGLAVVAWVGPTTDGGTALLILLPVVVCTTVAGLLSKLVWKKKAIEKDENVPPKDAPKDDQDYRT